jgi:hypothetical protein
MSGGCGRRSSILPGCPQRFRTGVRVPRDFGDADHCRAAHFCSCAPKLHDLSYELAQLTESDFFSADHRALIALSRRLSPREVLRLGGNTSSALVGDYTLLLANLGCAG